MLRVSDVHKTFETEMRPVQVLRGVSLEMQTGQALVVTGPSGSGKSTLLHLIGALEPPSSGRIEIDGKEPFGLPEAELARFRNRTIGFVFQEHHLLPQYSVANCCRVSSMNSTLLFGESWWRIERSLIRPSWMRSRMAGW